MSKRSTLWGLIVATLATLGCAEDSDATCPTFLAGVQQPVSVQTSFERLSNVEGALQVLVDDSGIYWFDRQGALHASSHDGVSAPVMLREAPAGGVYVMGPVADETTLYWSEGERLHFSSEPGPPPPPSRLFAVAKVGGEVRLLREESARVLRPLGVVGERVIVQASAAPPEVQAALWSVATDGSVLELTATRATVDTARIVDGKLYWTVASEPLVEGVDFRDLWRSNVDGSDAALVTRFEGWRFLVGEGRVLWTQERTHFEPLVLDQNYVMFDENTGCTQPLPALGESISLYPLMDAQHVYWQSYNGLDAISHGPGAPTGLDPLPLIRVDLHTGTIEQVVTPGFEPTLVDDVVGQTATRLFICENTGDLVAIDKPR